MVSPFWITANLSTLINSHGQLNVHSHKGFYFQASCQPIDWKVFYDKEFYFVLKTNPENNHIEASKGFTKSLLRYVGMVPILAWPHVFLISTDINDSIDCCHFIVSMANRICQIFTSVQLLMTVARKKEIASPQCFDTRFP